MGRIRIRLGSWVSLAVGVAIVFFLVGASAILPTSSSIARANAIPPCSTTGVVCIGNLEVISFTPFPKGSGGGCGSGATETILNNSQGIGFELSNFGGNPVCTISSPTGGSFSLSATLEVAGINGFLIDDINGSFNCGVNGPGVSAGLTLDPGLGVGSALNISCPVLPTGSTALQTGGVTFAPTDLITETITISGTSTGPATLSFSSFADQFSLVRASSVPEPGTFVLLGVGLLGLAFIARRQFTAA